MSEDQILDPSTQGAGDESARRRRARGGAGASGASGAAGSKTSSSANLFTKLVDAQSDESNWKVSGANFMWVPCSSVEEGKAFEVGEIKERKGKEIVVETESGDKKTFPIEEVFPMNPPKLTGIEDMARLSHLNEPSVLFNLKKRYDNDKIYTYSGLFLVAVNPYKNLPIYTDEVIKKHQGKRREDAEPHVFTVSDVAYRQMLQNQLNQSMLVTGESGAGKTENTKKIIQYLTSTAGSSHGAGKLEQQLLQTNPLLEAFGNAKTIRNNNSSRFGKFIEVDFNVSGYIAGTKIQHYLLETTRVVAQAPDERNFHFFYQILSDAQSRNKYHLQNVNQYHYVNQSGCTSVVGINDAQEFQETLKSMRIIGISEEDIDATCRMVASILHLGNCKFVNDENDLSMLPDRSPLNTAAELLGVDSDGLAKGFMKPNIVTPTDIIETHVNVAQAGFNRNALVKSMYNRLFDWLVRSINQSLTSKEKIKNFIGVLDIAGFEIFELNSFEQLCINYTNEKLQQFFNHHMFKKEQEEYLKEKIEWKFIDFGLDLQPTIDLIEKPLGILAILDQQTFMAQQSEEGLVREINKNHGTKKQFKTSRFNEKEFVLSHYAGDVPYNVVSWFTKNVDPLNEDCKGVMAASGNALIRSLFDLPGERQKAAEKRSVGSARFKTVATNYKNQLKDLMGLLESTEPHFIRCIKPNNLQKPGIIDDRLVLHQLKCNGVLEGIRIARKGYPGRIPYADFVKRYDLLVEDKRALEQQPNLRGKAQVILDTIKFEETTQYKLGATKVFLKASQEALIEEYREAQISKIIGVAQAAALAAYERVAYKKLQGRLISIKLIQRNFRAYLKLKNWGWWNLINLARPYLKEFSSEQVTKKLKEEFEQIKKDLEGERDSKKKLEIEKNALEQSRKKLIDDLEEQRNRMDAMNNALNQLEKELRDRKNEIDRLHHDCDDKDSELTRNTQSLAALNSNIKKLEEQIRDLKGEVDQREKIIKSKGSDLQNKDLEIETMNKKSKDLEKRIADLENTLADARNDINNKSNEVSRLQMELSDQGIQLENEINSRKAREEDLKKREKEIKDLKKELTDSQLGADQLDTELKKSKKEKQLLEEDLDKQKKAADQLQRKLTASEQQGANLSNQLDEETRKRQAAENKNRSLQSDLDNASSKLNDMENTLHDRDDLISQLQAEINKLKQRISDLESENQKLQERNKDLERELNDTRFRMEEELKNKNSEIDRLKKLSESSKDELTMQLNKTNDEKNDLTNKLKKAEKDLKNLKKSKDDLQAEKDDSDNRIRKLEQDLREKEQAAENLAKRISDLENEARTRDAQKKSTEMELASVKDDLNRTKQRAEQLQSDLDAQRERANELENLLSDTEGGKNQLDSQFKQLQSDLQNERNNLQKMKSDNERLQRELDELKRALSDKQNESSSLDSKVKTLEDKIRELTALLETERSSKTDLDKKRSKMDKEVKRLAQQLQETEQALKGETQKKNDADNRVKQLEGEVNNLKSERDRLNKDLNNQSGDVNGLKRQLDESNNLVAKLKAEIQKLQKDLSDHHGDRDEAEEQLQALRKQIQELTSRLADANNRTQQEASSRQSLESDNNRLKSEVARLRDDLQNENRKLKQEIERVQSESENEKSELLAQLQKLQEAYSEVKDELKDLSKNASRGGGVVGGVDSAEVEKLRREYELQLAQLKARVEEVTQQRVEVENKKRSVEMDLTEVKTRLQTEERLRKKVEQQKKSVEMECDELRELAEEAEDLRDELNRTKLEQQGLVQQLRQDLLQERHSRASAEEASSRQKREIEELQQDLEQERSKLDEAARRLKQQYENEILDLNNQIAQAKKERSAASRDMKKADRDLREYQRRFQEEARAKQDLEQRLTKVERENKLLQSQSQSDASKYQKSEQDKQRLEAENRQQKDKILELQDDLEKLRQQVNSERKKTQRIARKASPFNAGELIDDLQ
ncbi:hypothetical protein C9374_004926 [Naegleria lovaniensis]|uniref:Myosin heavy chain n=1 Tax=Naegleria lovaniensis TaxID=51637 RepID=A0AA88GPU7_NAELO|nr:uncharacterized protein C9374_004926 [Naegleria lovaniensis]KAG2382959.1 hypothetical protein C9374_004926 [Naegleria lovaniensis]